MMAVQSSSPWKGEAKEGGNSSIMHKSGTPTSILPLLGGGIFKDRLREGADLSKTNWFRVGGAAEFLFKPQDTQDLAKFLALLPPEIPVTVLGVGSNLIVRDGGIDGVVIKLGRGFTQITPSPLEGEGRVGGIAPPPAPSLKGRGNIVAGAACLDVHLAQFACDSGIAGLEFFAGIPGTVGGAVRMNAGAYGSDTSRVLVDCEYVTRDGKIRRAAHTELKFVYRNSALPEGAIVTHATFKAVAGDKAAIAKKMQEITTAREETQPVRSRTGGSTFKNPDGHKAWELIERAGCRGLTVGGAQVSEKHCNFLINTGNATAKDLENLGEEVIKRVRDKTGIALEWEIKRIGKVT